MTSCARCINRSRFGNCLLPVNAGIADRHQLIRHPNGGRDCSAFAPRPHPADARIADLQAARLIEEWEADLIRSSYWKYPRDWDRIMDDIKRTGREIPFVLPDAVMPREEREWREERS